MYKFLIAVALGVFASASAAESLRDPTRPPQSGGAQASVTRSMTLESIIFSDQRRVAVIDGQSLREGEALRGARVLRIHPDRVELRVNQTTRTLRLVPRQPVRQSPE